MHKIRFPLGLCPRPHWGELTALPQTPKLYLRGPKIFHVDMSDSATSKGRAGDGKGTVGGSEGEEWGKGRDQARKYFSLEPPLMSA